MANAVERNKEEEEEEEKEGKVITECEPLVAPGACVHLSTILL